MAGINLVPLPRQPPFAFTDEPGGTARDAYPEAVWPEPVDTSGPINLVPTDYGRGALPEDDRPISGFPRGGPPIRPQVLAQGAGRGVADAIGGIPDLATAAANAGLSTLDWIAQLFGQNVDYRFPGGVSDLIADTASDVGEDVFDITPLDYEDMTDSERLGYQATRFGTSAAVPAVGLAGIASRTAPSVFPRIGDSLLDPYRGTPLTTMARDTTAGVGSGTLVGAYDNAFETTDEDRGVFGSLLPMIAGAVGGSAIFDAARFGTPAAGLAHAVRRSMTDRNIPYDENRVGTSWSTAIDTGNYLRREAGGDDAAHAAVPVLQQTQADMEAIGAPMLPLGQATQNPGLAAVERTARNLDNTPFFESDRAVTTWGGEQIQGIAPNADPELFPRAAASRLEDTAADAERLGGMGGSEAMQDASTRFRTGVIDETMVPLQDQSAAMYAAVDPGRVAMVDVTPVATVAKRVAATVGDFNDPASVLPNGLLERIGEAGKGGQTSIGDIAAVMPEISATLQRAERAGAQGAPGAFALAKNLRTLQRELYAVADAAAARGDQAALDFQAARQNWQNTIGSTFDQGAGDAATELRSDFLQSKWTGSTTPASGMPGRFLDTAKPENSESFQRVLAQNQNNPAGLALAASDIVLGNLTQRLIGPGGQFNAGQLNRFIDEWRVVAKNVPGLQQDLDNLAQAVRAGADVQGSALFLVARHSPQNAVAALMKAPDPATAAADLIARLDPAAQESFQRATADWLYRRVTNTNSAQTSNATLPLSWPKLVNTLENPNVDRFLAEVFSPDQMAAMQQVRRVFDLRGILSATTPAGSATASNLANQWRLFEAGLRMWFGGFTGGNYARNIKVAIGNAFSGQRDTAVQQLALRAATDPRIAEHLLLLNTRTPPAAWGSKLRRLLNLEEAARQINRNGEDEKPDEAKDKPSPNKQAYDPFLGPAAGQPYTPSPRPNRLGTPTATGAASAGPSAGSVTPPASQSPTAGVGPSVTNLPPVPQPAAAMPVQPGPEPSVAPPTPTAPPVTARPVNLVPRSLLPPRPTGNAPVNVAPSAPVTPAVPAPERVPLGLIRTAEPWPVPTAAAPVAPQARPMPAQPAASMPVPSAPASTPVQQAGAPIAPQAMPTPVPMAGAVPAQQAGAPLASAADPVQAILSALPPVIAESPIVRRLVQVLSMPGMTPEYLQAILERGIPALGEFGPRPEPAGPPVDDLGFPVKPAL